MGLGGTTNYVRHGEKGTESLEIHPLSHRVENKVGRRNPSIHKGVPFVPHVPSSKQKNQINSRAFGGEAASECQLYRCSLTRPSSYVGLDSEKFFRASSLL